MRKTVTTAIAAATIFGSMGMLAPTAVAAAPAERQSVTARAADCVKVVRWYSKRFDRMVEVENKCSRKACFSVTVAARRDPEFAIGANKKQSFRYSGTLWTKGTGIKNIGC
ncbi:hypothetical protein [Streptomyces peucetius]|uniref:Uncharacterized protein n=1 Tax=Streptomyces peucetius TaxID=1950 RepID=A0ABY6IE02_STRPE|nr:hypothetical protein [Streptomyces peucetius]UYQ64410.1 hypothetical protein OGH68_25040 [Streptomyces peucetius]